MESHTSKPSQVGSQNCADGSHFQRICANSECAICKISFQRWGFQKKLQLKPSQNWSKQFNGYPGSSPNNRPSKLHRSHAWLYAPTAPRLRNHQLPTGPPSWSKWAILKDTKSSNPKLSKKWSTSQHLLTIWFSMLGSQRCFNPCAQDPWL